MKQCAAVTSIIAGEVKPCRQHITNTENKTAGKWKNTTKRHRKCGNHSQSCMEYMLADKMLKLPVTASDSVATHCYQQLLPCNSRFYFGFLPH